MDNKNQEPLAQATETKRRAAGIVRVKPRHLSPLLQQAICDSFRACKSTEDIAEDLRIPVRTVTDVILAAALRMGPQPERGNVMAMRRSA